MEGVEFTKLALKVRGLDGKKMTKVKRMTGLLSQK